VSSLSELLKYIQSIFGITTFTGAAKWYPAAAIPVLVATLAVAYVANKLLLSTPPTEAPASLNSSENNTSSGHSSFWSKSFLPLNKNDKFAANSDALGVDKTKSQSLFPLRSRKSKNNDLENVVPAPIFEPEYGILAAEPTSEVREVLTTW
jgi:hypothetical protein